MQWNILDEHAEHTLHTGVDYEFFEELCLKLEFSNQQHCLPEN